MYTDKELLYTTQIAYYNFDKKMIEELTVKNGGTAPTLQDILSEDRQRAQREPNSKNSIYAELERTLNDAKKKESELEIIRAQQAIKKYEEIENGTVCNGWRLVDVRNENNTTGMVGCVLDTGDGNAMIGFRGSESNNSGQVLMDWIVSDIGLLNAHETVQQKSAENYMKYIAENYGANYKNIATSGHSLGGNLALHAALNAPNVLRKKITQAYSMDGPGYSNEYILTHAKQILTMKPGVMQHRGWSVVGALLNPLSCAEYSWVQVDEKVKGIGVQKHDVSFTQFNGDDFILGGKQDLLAAGMGDMSSVLDNTYFDLGTITLAVADYYLETYGKKKAIERAEKDLEAFEAEHDFENEQAIADFLKEKTGNEKPEYLVRGSLLSCKCGTHARRLNLLKCHGVTVKGHPVVHDRNCLTESERNLSSFGVCNGANPPCTEEVSYTKDILRGSGGEQIGEAPGGFVKGRKCQPFIIGGKWLESYPKTRIVDNGEINPYDRKTAEFSDGMIQPSGEAAVTTLSFLVCKSGGLIEPYNSGQNYENDQAEGESANGMEN